MDKSSELGATSPEGKANIDQIIGGDPVVDPCHDSIKAEEQSMSASVPESLTCAKVCQPC